MVLGSVCDRVRAPVLLHLFGGERSLTAAAAAELVGRRRLRAIAIVAIAVASAAHDRDDELLLACCYFLLEVGKGFRCCCYCGVLWSCPDCDWRVADGSFRKGKLASWL